MKNIVFISTIIATNILSFISSLILEPSFTLKILNVCILIICQWTVYMSDEKKAKLCISNQIHCKNQFSIFNFN